MNKQQVIVYLLVGIMFLSVIGTGVLLATGGGNQSNSQQDDLAAQLEQLQSQQEAQAACPPLSGDEKFDSAGKTPEKFTVDSKVNDVQTTDLVKGNGKEVKDANACVTVHYHGTLAENGEVFDSSYELDEPVKFSLNAVIPGWQQGVPGMKVGGTRRIVIPSDLAYGEAGSPPAIPANADLVFVVKLLDVE